MTARNPFQVPLPPPPEDYSGLSRLAIALMNLRLSHGEVSRATGIPRPTITQYVNCQQPISKRHLPLLAVAADVAADRLCGWAGPEDSPVLPDEWSDDNPFFYRRNFSDGRVLDSKHPLRPDSDRLQR